MKSRRTLTTFLSAIFIIMAMSSCVEHRYYARHNYHTERYYVHHPHRHPPPGVDIHIRN